MFWKISNRIIVSFVALIIILIAALLFLIIGHTREYYLSLLKREINEKINMVELEIKQAPGNYLYGSIREREDRIRSLSRIINLRITLVDNSGAVIADSEYTRVDEMDNHKYRDEIQQAQRSGTGESIRYSSTLHSDLLYLARKSDAIIIRLAKPLAEVDESISRLFRYILAAGFAAALISGFLVIVIARRITRPIHETMSFASDFSDGDFSRRIRNYRNDEIGTLQRALNRLADTAQDKINGLIEEQNKLAVTIESIHDGIIVIGRDKRILLANKASLALLDLVTPVISRLFFEVIRNRSLNSRLEQVHADGKAAAFDEQLLNGRHCEIVINPVKEEETIQGMLLVVHDITEKKKIERMKTDLVSNLSHELKTPIAILRGYLETLEQYLADPAMARDLLQKALASVDRQDALINDILQLNRLETSADFLMETIELIDVIQGCVDILDHKALKNNISIRFDNNGIEGSVPGNRFLAEEIFFNIIDNGINYNHEGGSVDIDMKKSGGRILVSIKDTGIGIPADSIDRIFERFYRVDKSRSRATGGTGLGLSIAKHAAEILNWNISVESGGRGTMFVVEI
jgi:two-component system, OmpR family, phosphate regulon sensor histidine kinase PhoR